jgi:hypothetical protein
MAVFSANGRERRRSEAIKLAAISLSAIAIFAGVALRRRIPQRPDLEAMYSLRYSVVLVTLMACIAFTAIGSSRNNRDGVQGRGTPELAISDEQRGHIFEIIMRISDAPVANGPTPEITDALPEQVPMQDLPAEVSQDVPLVRGDKFVKFDDRILIVRPSSRLVVAMIPQYKLVP